MGEYDNGVAPITAPWPAQDIIYVAVITPVMLAAFLEWFLWLAAFLYCLVKVFQKAEHWSIRVLAIMMMILFTALRGIFLPVMIVTLPLPARITQYFPEQMVWFLQWFAFYTFSVLLTVPWMLCVFRVVTTTVGRRRRIKEVLDDRVAPKTVVIMPVYKEEPAVLLKAINSVVDCDYPPSCIHVFLSFDGDQVDELYLSVAKQLGIPDDMEKQLYPQSIDVVYKSSRITVSRFKHGGKRHCQKQTFKLIDKIYAHYLKRHDNLFVLFIDSDCILDRVCLQNFMYDMELKPGSKHNMLAMTGVITSTTEKNSLITILQDMEYIHGQLFERSVESGCGAVTCLPGALTMLRFSAFRKMAKYYFADKAEQCEDLFMIGARKRYQIQMCTSAFCKTEAVQTFQSLLKQRRRWFLGFITNEVCMLTDIRLWARYPILCTIRFMQNTIRTTALLFFIMVISILTTSNRVNNLPVGFLAVSLGLNYLLMLYFGLVLRRFKAWLYPLMFLLNPFFNWLYMVYGIFTAGQRTWGGPRADAAKADEHTTPREAAELAKAQGDELNVDVETFRAEYDTAAPVPIHPTESVEGRFARRMGYSSEAYYTGPNESGITLVPLVSPGLQVPRLPLRHRPSFDSIITVGSGGDYSIRLPRRVESLMSEEEQRKLYFARQAQRSSSAFNDPGEADSAQSMPWMAPSRKSSFSSTDRLSSSPSPQISPILSGIRPPEVMPSPSRAPEIVLDPLKQLHPLQPTRSPLGRNRPQQAYWGDEDEVNPRAPLTGDMSSEGPSHPPSKPEKKRRRLMKRVRRPEDQV